MVSWTLVRQPSADAASSNPSMRDHARPWRALPGLAKFSGVVSIDNDASLAPAPSAWGRGALLTALQGVGVETFGERGFARIPPLQFLEMEPTRYVGTSRVQDALVALLKGDASDRVVGYSRQPSAFRTRVISLP